VAGQSAALAADEEFVHALHERTDGVPLFVASVLGDVIEHMASGGAGHTAGTAMDAMPVPENLAAIIEHFVARLGEEEQAMLGTAAVCGSEFSPDTVAEAMERDAGWVSATCERQARAHMWLAAPRAAQQAVGPEVRYAFRHALLREVLYERTPPAIRAQLHRKVGAALERERERGRAVAASQLAMHFDRGGDPLTALRYYGEAAEAALLNLSPAECMSLTERALVLLEQAPQDPQHDTRGITLSTWRGIAAFNVVGPGAEAKEAFMRAYTLLDRVPQHAFRAQLLHGLGVLLFVRAEYAEALALAERAAALSAATGEPVLLLSACTVQGQVQMMQGRPVAARASAEQALPVMDSAEDAAQQSFVAVPQVVLLAHLALQLFHLGLLRQARARLREAHERAQQLRQPMAQLYVLWFDALIEVRLGNAPRVAKLAKELQALVEDSGLVQGRAAAQWFLGWAQARQGEARGGYRLIRKAYEGNTAVGMRAGGSETLGYAAEALLLAGDVDGAERELNEALRIGDVHGERVYLPQLLLTEAAIARARGQKAAADASLRRALEEARRQQAPWLELVALVELCEHGGADKLERQALAELVLRLPELADTAAAAKARALLD
jgi:tetratricopeptide (TPR) repeat protein